MQQQMTHQQANRSEVLNPQKTWEEFKTNITTMARKTAKEHLHKIRIRTKQLKEDIKCTLENSDLDTDESTRHHKAWIESKIEHLERIKFKNTQLHSQANWALNGETIS
jgi:hypothetical protein